MNSLLQSSLMGHDFVKYKKQHNEHERTTFSSSVRTKGIGEIPVVIDSIDESISHALAGSEAKRYNRNGKEYRFHKDLLIEDVLLEVKHQIKFDDTKLLKVGLENGKILDDKDTVGDLYKKYKDQKDDILYLLLTQETTMYGYIVSLLRSVFGPNFMKFSKN
jgi:hypothetical protein